MTDAQCVAIIAAIRQLKPFATDYGPICVTDAIELLDEAKRQERDAAPPAAREACVVSSDEPDGTVRWWCITPTRYDAERWARENNGLLPTGAEFKIRLYGA